jgi:hypothetical protein
MKKATMTLLAVTGVLLFTVSSFAADKKPNELYKRFNIDLGASRLFNESKVRLGGKNVGVEVDVEEALDVETQTTSFRMDGYWRFTRNRRHRLDFTYYYNKRTGESVVDKDLEIGEITIPTGAKVETKLNFDLFRVGYSYSFFQDDRMDLGVGLGLYVLPIRFSLDASGDVLGQPISESVKENFAAPLPVVTLRFDFAITPRWFLRNRIDVFYLEYDKYKGAIADSRIALEYAPFKHVGFGLAWDNFRLKAEAEDEDTGIPGATFKGTFDFKNQGIMLYLKCFF